MFKDLFIVQTLQSLSTQIANLFNYKKICATVSLAVPSAPSGSADFINFGIGFGVGQRTDLVTVPSSPDHIAINMGETSADFIRLRLVVDYTVTTTPTTPLSVGLSGYTDADTKTALASSKPAALYGDANTSGYAIGLALLDASGSVGITIEAGNLSDYTINSISIEVDEP